MDQERLTPAPEEQFNEQPPIETIQIEPAAPAVTATETPIAEESVIEEPIIKVLVEAVPAEALAAAVNYATLGLPEILLEFDRLLHLENGAELQKNAELLKAYFYKGLRKERGETLPADAAEGEVHEEEISVETEDVHEEESITTDVPLLFLEEENAFKKMYAKYKSLRADFFKQQELQKEKNLVLKHAIIEEIKVLVEKQEDPNHTFPEFRALQTRWKEVGPVPIANTKDVWDTYQHYVEKFYDYVKINNELRDLDFKKNLEQKTLLCEKAEELLLESGIVSAFHKLQKLHDEWRESGPVAREQREQIWERFKVATSAINKKHQEYFEEQKIIQKKNLEEKTVLCEKAEEIAQAKIEDANDWNKYSKELENLQKMWRTIGFASKKDNQKIYDRFRAACNSFYNTKRQHYSQFKQEMQGNYERKAALCEQAEALNQSEDWKKTTDLLINLQRQWKEIGPVARKQSDIIWKRFRVACDAFFEKKSKHFSKVDGDYDANLAAKEALLAEIRAYEPLTDSAENLTALKEFQRRWAEIGFVPIKQKEKIQTAYREAFDIHFNNLRSNEGERKVNKFKKRVDEMHTGGKPERAFRSEREKLLFKFRQMESDINVWENNLGFFAKSKNAESLIADIERKIALAKEELAVLEEKIKLMDKQFE